jgi:predicted Zn finger-like uncharacterized protein
MIVICDKCGKGYQIDPEQIGGETATFQCDACNHVITVTQQATDPGDPFPLNPGNPGTPVDSGYIDLAEEVVETVLSTPETPSEVPPDIGFGEQSPLNLGDHEFMQLAEKVLGTPLSIPETPSEVPPVSGVGARRPLGLGDPEYINLAEEDVGTPVSAPETIRAVPSVAGVGARRPLGLDVPEYINLADEIVSAGTRKSEIGLRDKVFFLGPICLIIVAGILLLIL